MKQVYGSLVFTLVGWLSGPATASNGGCPNLCSGHGNCNQALICECQDEGVIINPEGNDGQIQAGWTGADCSLKKCPRGLSWIEPALDGTVSGEYCTHAEGAECSDRGTCDRDTGQCVCLAGYSGSACHRMDCPNECNGHGVCQSSVKFAQDATIALNLEKYAAEGINGQYGYLVSYDNAWDSQMGYGCKCDVGYRGPDCSLVECPTDDDPLDQFCDSDNLNGLYEFVGELYYDSAEEGTLTARERPVPNHFLTYNTMYGTNATECSITEEGEYILNTTELDGNCVVARFCHGARSGQPCGGQGICDYTDGTCDCFNGFSGSACTDIVDLM